MLKLNWEQALAWRMRRQLLDPVGNLSVAGVVRRLCGIQTQVASSAELAVRVRRETSRRGEVARALAEGRVIRRGLCAARCTCSHRRKAAPSSR